jgi:hypothetical protein
LAALHARRFGLFHGNEILKQTARGDRWFAT